VRSASPPTQPPTGPVGPTGPTGLTEPVEPPPCRWELPPATIADDHGIVGLGADLEPGTLLAAYRSGLFPMRLRRNVLAWWSPDPRGVLPLDGMHVSRSLRRAARHFDVTVDRAFEAVMRGCADPKRPHGWIDESFVDAYTRLHDLGWAHSVEVWQGDELVGGVYGVRIARFFAGESMFHRVTNASKVALHAAVELLRLDGVELFDVQWTTEHLCSLGAVDLRRDEYLQPQIFHNPSCSKSRGALEILNDRGTDPDVVKYLDTPPDRATLERILDAIDDPPAALVRTDDKKFKDLGLTASDYTERDAVIALLLEHPALMQRPVVFVGEKAVIARPSERVLEIL
jgi:leucyl/phenylalanyl-tRNA---protein transferase